MNKFNLNKVVPAAMALALLATTARAQLTGCNGFIQGNYIEVGVNGLGSYGSTVSAPDGYHPRGGSGVYNSCTSTGGPSGTNLGFVADPDKDGWDVGSPNYVGDYFLPGSPYEGWEIQVNGDRYDQNNGAGTSLGEVTSVVNTGSYRSVYWEGTYSGLSIKQVTSLDTGSLFFTCQVTLKNTTDGTLPAVYYLRGVDPDQEVPMGGDYYTNNTIVYQRPTNAATLVTATGNDFGAYLGLGTLDPRAKAYILPSWPPSADLANIHNGTAGGFTFTGSHNGDYAIGIVYNIGDMAPGDSTTLTFVYILRGSDFMSGLLSTIPNWSCTGDTVLAHDLASRDTATVCQSISTTVSISTPGSRTWHWTALSGETLSASTGSSVSLTTGTSLIRLIARAIAADSVHYDTVFMYLNPAIPMPSTPTASSSASGPVCFGAPVTLSAAGGGGSATYHWAGPGGYSAAGASVTFPAGSSSSGVYSVYAANYACHSPKVTTSLEVDMSSYVEGRENMCAGTSWGFSAASSGGTWSSSNPSVATVDMYGYVNAIAPGVANIIYTTSTCAGMVTVTVNAGPTLTSSTGSFDFLVGEEITISSPYYGYWDADDYSIVDISGCCTSIDVTGLSVGTTTIRLEPDEEEGDACPSIVTVNVLAPLSIEGPASVCVGSSSTLIPSETGGYWTTDNPSVAYVGSTGIVSAVAPGSAIITYTLGLYSATFSITVTGAPSITGPGSVCVGENASLTGTPGEGTWESSNPTVANISALAGVVYGATAGTATITYVAPSGCSTTTVFTVNANPAAPGGTATVCAGSSTTLTSGVSGTWSSSNTAVATVPSFPSVVTGVAEGMATITFHATATGCYSTREITVNAVPAAIAGNDNLCIGTPATYTSATTGGVWSRTCTPSGAFTIDASTGAATASAAGSGTITYSAGGCLATKSISVLAQPNAITGTASMCVGSATTLTSTTSGGTWSSSDNAVATAATATATTGTVSGVSAGTATIYYTNAGGCARAYVVTVTAAPPAIGGGSSVCLGGNITLTNATTGGTWSSSTPAVSSINAISGVARGNTVGNATITYATSATCFTTTVVSVTSSPAAITGPNRVCIGSNITLAHEISGGSWSSNTPARASVDAVSGVVSGLSTGTTVITYATGSGGCFTTRIVSVNALPLAIGGTASVCESANTNLTNTTAGGGIWSNDGANATVGSTGIVTGVAAGTSVITFEANATGCRTTRTVTVNATPTAIGGTTAVCIGAAATLTSTPAGGTWQSSNTAAAPVNSSTGSFTAGGTTTAYPVISYTMPTGCRRTATITVSALPGTISGAGTPFCVGTTASVTATTASLTWSSTNTAVATIAPYSTIAAQVTGAAPGTSTISYTNAAGCARTLVVTVTAAPADITGPDEICVAGSATMTSSTPGGTWASSNPAKASIASTTGVLTGVALGGTTITYRTSAACYTTKTVNVVTAPSGGITGPSGVCIGSDVTFTHTSSGGTWATSNPYFATVNAVSGLVSGVSQGTLTITYTVAPGCISTKPITIYPYVYPISGTYTVCVGSTALLNVAQTGGTWSISNTAIGTLSYAGAAATNLNGVSAGTATVTYLYPTTGCYSLRTVTVHPVPATVTGPSSVCIGSNITLATTTTGGSWVTGAGIYATVDAGTGVVTGVAAATVNISYRNSFGCVAQKNITVNPLPGVINGATSIGTITNPTATLTCTPAGGQWTSSDAGVATIGLASGVVSSVSAGTTNITYTIPATGCFRTRVQTVVAGRPMAGTTGSTDAAGNTRIFPTPTTGMLTVEAAVSGNFKVMTIDGRIVAQYPINAASTTINLPSDLAAGIYMCRFEGVDGIVETLKVVLTK